MAVNVAVRSISSGFEAAVSSFTVTLPSGLQVDDEIVLICSASVPNATLPFGTTGIPWEVVLSIPSASPFNTPHTEVYMRRYRANDPSTILIGTTLSTNVIWACIALYSTVGGERCRRTYRTSVSSPTFGVSHVAPDLTAPSAGNLLLGVFSGEANPPGTWTAPGGMTEILDFASAFGSNDHFIGVFTENFDSEAATGTRTATSSVSSYATCLLLSFSTQPTIKYVSHTSGSAHGAGATDVVDAVLSKPGSIQAGDVLFAAIAVRGGTGAVISQRPLGWGHVATIDNGTTLKLIILTKQFLSGDPSSWHFFAVGDIGVAWAVVAYRNYALDRSQYILLSGTQNDGSGTSQSVPSLTPSIGYLGQIAFFAASDNLTFTPPGTMTERLDLGQAGAAPVSLSVADRRIQSSGATGVQTATTSLSALHSSATVLLAEDGLYQPGGSGTAIWCHDAIRAPNGLYFTYPDYARGFPWELEQHSEFSQGVFIARASINVGPVGGRMFWYTKFDDRNQVIAMISGKLPGYGFSVGTNSELDVLVGDKAGTGTEAIGYNGCNMAMISGGAIGMGGTTRIYGTTFRSITGALTPSLGIGELVSCMFDGVAQAALGNPNLPSALIRSVRIRVGSTAQFGLVNAGSTVTDRVELVGTPLQAYINSGAFGTDLKNVILSGTPGISDVRISAAGGGNIRLGNVAWSMNGVKPKLSWLGAGTFPLDEYVEWIISVQKPNGAGPQQMITVDVYDKNAALTLSVMTGANGKATWGIRAQNDTLLVVKHQRFASVYTIDYQGPFHVIVNDNGPNHNPNYPIVPFTFTWADIENFTTTTGILKPMGATVILGEDTSNVTIWSECSGG